MSQAAPTILVNPRRKARRRKANSSKHTRRRRRRNPAAPAAYAVSNPRRRRRRRRNPYVGTMEMVRRANPVRRRRRRNPFPKVRAFGVNVSGALKTAVAVGAGIYGARYLSRAVLGQKDQGVLGYGGTALAGVLIAAGARMLGTSPETAQQLAAGAAVSLLGRGVVDVAKKVGATGPLIAALNDYQDIGYTSPYIESGIGVAGLGIPELDIDSSYDGLGDYTPGGLGFSTSAYETCKGWLNDRMGGTRYARQRMFDHCMIEN